MKLFTKIFGFIAIIACLFIAASQTEVSAGGFQKIEYVSGLAASTDVNFTPDGRMLVAEKIGRIKVVQNGQLLTQPLIDITSRVNNFGDRGLLSFALDPDFSQNGYIYLLYTFQSPSTPNDGDKTARLTRIQVDPLANVASPQVNPSETILLGSIDVPFGAGNTACQPGTDCISTDGSSHTVGEVIFAPDKTMYVSIGDGSDFNAVDINALRALSLDWMNGKVLHIDKNGKGLPTNPFFTGNPDDVRSKVYHYGLRNPFRISYDADNGLYVTDTGWNLWEEVNRAPAGSNFGWPCYEGNAQQPLYSLNALTSIQCQQIYAQNNHVMPMFAYPHGGTGAAIAGGTTYKGTSYPASYYNNYFYADYNDMYLKRLILDENGDFVAEEEFINDVLGPINVFNFPDGDIGAIYVWGGKIYKFNFDPTNRAPIASAKADKQSGGNPLVIQFDGSESSDLDVEDELTYAWDFGDGSSSSEMNPVHTYTVNGIYAAKLTVTDKFNATNESTLRIDVGNHAPVPVILSPKADEGFLDPYTVHFEGVATDEEDGQLGETRLNWHLILHHNEHVHYLIDGQLGSGGDIPLDYHGENTYYELTLTATDNSGLQATTSTKFYIYQKQNVCAAGSQCLGLWNMNANANDLTPAQYNGVLSGDVNCSAATVGRVGGACTFGAAGGKISLPQKNVTNFTLNMWVKPEDSNNIQVLASNKNSGFTQNGFGLFLNAWQTNNRQIIMEIGNGTAGQHIASATGVAKSDEWQMITVVFNGTNVILYRNGVQIANEVANHEFLKDAPLYFGAYANNNLPMRGVLDDTSLWGKALTPVEIVTLYNSAPVCDAPPQLGSIKFGIREFSAANTWTSGYLNDVTVKLTDVTGNNVIKTATSAAVGLQGGRAEFKDIPVGQYGIMAYKTGYTGVWKQLTCGGSGTTTNATIQNIASENRIAAWQNNVTVTANTITWCQDLGLKQDAAPVATGEVKFGIREYNVQGVWTGGYVDGATVKLTDIAGSSVVSTTTSAPYGDKAGRVTFTNVPVGQYGIMVYKAGYTGIWKQTTCAGAGTQTGATIQNANTGGLTAAWNNDIAITANTTTWCKDMGIMISGMTVMSAAADPTPTPSAVLTPSVTPSVTVAPTPMPQQ